MYVDGFVIPIPKDQIAAYKKLAKKAGQIWMELGALSYCECLADDVSKGKVTSFPRAVKAKPSETVVFSWITYKSKADRNRINKAVMKHPFFQSEAMSSVQFDGKRMFMGGFKPIVEI